MRHWLKGAHIIEPAVGKRLVKQHHTFKELLCLAMLGLLLVGNTACSGGGSGSPGGPPTLSPTEEPPVPVGPVQTLPSMPTWTRDLQGEGGAVLDNENIAQEALSRVGPGGLKGGQCYKFVNDVLTKLSGSSSAYIGGWDLYFWKYDKVGGIRQTSDSATRGDIIQISDPKQDNSYFTGMHTAIIIENRGGGKFDVVDSNFHSPGDEIIRHHDNWAPSSLVDFGNNQCKQACHLQVDFWRMGVTSSSPSTTQPVSSGPSANGTVQTEKPSSPHDPPLRVHTGPHLTDPALGTTLPAGTKVSIDCQTHGDMFNDGNYGPTDIWDHVTGSVSGYVTDGLVYTGSNQMVTGACH